MYTRSKRLPSFEFYPNYGYSRIIYLGSQSSPRNLSFDTSAPSSCVPVAFGSVGPRNQIEQIFHDGKSLAAMMSNICFNPLEKFSTSLRRNRACHWFSLPPGESSPSHLPTSTTSPPFPDASSGNFNPNLTRTSIIATASSPGMDTWIRITDGETINGILQVKRHQLSFPHQQWATEA